jgi:hypothetical protein
VATIQVVLLGSPQGSDITVNLSVDASSTAASNQYDLASNSIVIPAGESSGSTTLTGISSEIPELETVTVVLNMDAGGVEAETANQMTVSLYRIKFCEWAVDDMVGDYTGTDDAWYSGGTYSNKSFTIAKVDDNTITISGLGAGQYEDAWGEAVTAGDLVTFTVNPDGTLTFENQYLCETDNVWDYYMGPRAPGTAKWDGCNESFDILWYAHWDDAYGDDMPGHSVFTKN